MDIIAYKLPDHLIRPKDHIPNISSVDARTLPIEWEIPIETDHVWLSHDDHLLLLPYHPIHTMVK